MATAGLIGTINRLVSQGLSEEVAFGQALTLFPQLDPGVFSTMFSRGLGRQQATAALARVQNPDYRAGPRSTLFTEFHVPEQYRYTFRFTAVNFRGEEKTFYASLYHGEKLTRREAEELGMTYGQNLMESGASRKAQIGEGFELVGVRWTLFEQNISEE